MGWHWLRLVYDFTENFDCTSLMFKSVLHTQYPLFYVLVFIHNIVEMGIL